MNLDQPMYATKKRILVVDDRVSDTRLIKLYLEGTNDYIVREENDAKVALTTAEKFKPDLILLDLMMPGIDGGELAAQFESNPRLKTIPIVFLTASVTKGEVDAVDGWIGRFPFLAKPVVMTELAACLRKHLHE